MQKLKLTRLASHLRLPFALLSALVLFTGCGSDKNEEEKENKKAPSERVVILRERFDQLQNSLDEMERDLKIQRQRIDDTRELAKSIRRSLVQGNLKGYSIDTVTTEVALLKAEKKKAKKQEQKAEDADKEDAENSVLDALLIILFFIFIIVIFAVALKDRKQDVPPYNPVSPSDDYEPNDISSETVESTNNYGELGTSGSIDNETPPPFDETHGNEDRQQ